jgi:GTP-binding protein
MPFVDETRVHVRAGRGGDGSASMRREPFTPRGGPDGGDGGDGSDVVLRASGRVDDLSWLADHPHQRAADGKAGQRARRDGGRGGDLILEVPVGTVAFDQRGLLADLPREGDQAVVARGGRGGRGNSRFVSSRNRAPRTAERGEEGEEGDLRLELRTVADVGLVGLPNAGKSTLLSGLTAAAPRIADYPFTTLTPNLGVAGDEERFVVADVPGLVEGAHEGKGLGHRFLRHVLRCRALLLVVDLSAADPGTDLEVLRGELTSFDPDLLAKPSVVVATKADLVDDPREAARRLGGIAVSGLTGKGLDDLRERMGRLARAASAAEPARAPYVALRPGRPRFTVTREGSGWRVAGRGVERWIRDVDLDDDRQVAELQRKLIREGVERELARAGARRGDEVTIAGATFEFLPGERPAVAAEDG